MVNTLTPGTTWQDGLTTKKIIKNKFRADLWIFMLQKNEKNELAVWLQPTKHKNVKNSLSNSPISHFLFWNIKLIATNW